MKIPPLRGAPGRLAPRARKIPPRFALRDFRAGWPRLGGIPHSHLPGGEAERYPPPGLACRLGRFAAERHWRSLTPSHALTVQKRVAFWHGRGTVLYSLIPKGETHVSPFDNPLYCGSLPISQKVSSSGGLPKGVAACRWHASSDRSHLPLRVLRPGGARPGPTDAAAETGAERSPLATSARAGRRDQGVGRLAPQANKIPPQRALRDFQPPWPTRLGKPSPKTPVSERSERIGVFPGPSGHGPGTRQARRGWACIKLSPAGEGLPKKREESVCSPLLLRWDAVRSGPAPGGHPCRCPARRGRR